jgi:hypothetical protein
LKEVEAEAEGNGETLEEIAERQEEARQATIAWQEEKERNRLAVEEQIEKKRQEEEYVRMAVEAADREEAAERKV